VRAAALDHWLALDGHDVDARLAVALGELGLHAGLSEQPAETLIRRPGIPSALRRSRGQSAGKPRDRSVSGATGRKLGIKPESLSCAGLASPARQPSGRCTSRSRTNLSAENLTRSKR